VLLVLFGAGCASRGTTNVSAVRDAASVIPAAPVVESTTTTSTAPAAEPAPEPVVAPTPVVNAKPLPATIEVDYQPQDGATANATIHGPNGSHTKSLASGAALFGGLPTGTYAVTITVDTPSGDPTVGDARVIINGNSVHVEPGEHATISCDDSGCTGTL
jgi:hypothetical protein